jgi:hypothetical protein
MDYQALIEELELDYSASTLQKRLHQRGYFRCVACQKRGAGGLDIHFSSDRHARPVRPSPEVLISELPYIAIYLTSTSKFSLY